MTVATVDHSARLDLHISAIRLAVAAVVAIALLAAAFVVGRTTAPNTTVTTGISAPAASGGSSTGLCHFDRAC